MPADARTPRRLPPAERRAQLVRAARTVIAAQGYSDFALDEVARGAGVTRNLLYRYFPNGRLDLFVAALEDAGAELAGGWVTDPDLPLAERLERNFARMAEHAAGPSEAWQ